MTNYMDSKTESDDRWKKVPIRVGSLTLSGHVPKDGPTVSHLLMAEEKSQVRLEIGQEIDVSGILFRIVGRIDNCQDITAVSWPHYDVYVEPVEK